MLNIAGFLVMYYLSFDCHVKGKILDGVTNMCRAMNGSAIFLISNMSFENIELHFGYFESAIYQNSNLKYITIQRRNSCFAFKKIYHATDMEISIWLDMQNESSYSWLYLNSNLV